MGGAPSVAAPVHGSSPHGGGGHVGPANAHKPTKTPRSKSTGATHAMSPSDRLLSTYDDQVRAAQKKVRPHSWFNYMYAKYLPNMCRDRFGVDSNELKEAELERFEGVVAFVDISGFTKLSEYLVNKHGPDSAAELLNKFISGYFEKLVEVVVLHGGDIIKFAGDAMLVVWRNKRESLANTIKPSMLPPPNPKGTLTGALTPDMLKANHDGKARTSISQASSVSGAAPGSSDTPTLTPAAAAAAAAASATASGAAPDVNHLAALALSMTSLAAGVMPGTAGASAAATTPGGAAAMVAAALAASAAATASSSSGSVPPTHPHLSVNTTTSSPALTPAATATLGAVSTPGAADMTLNAGSKRISSARNGTSLPASTPSGVTVGVAPSPAALLIDGKSPPASPPGGSRGLAAPKITIESPSHSHPAAHAAAAAAAGAGGDGKQLGLHLSTAGSNGNGPDPSTPGSRNSVSGVVSPTHAGGVQPSGAGGAPGIVKGRSAHSRVASLAALERGGAESLSTLVLRATACNLVLLSKLNNYKAADGDDIRLTLHTGIACGEICGLYVGGVQGMWEFYVAGDPIKDMSDAAEVAQSGQVVISAKAYALIADKCDSMQRAHDCVQVLHLRITPPIHASPQPFIAPEAERAANAFIPPIVRNRIEAGQTASWLAEFRRVCIMFIALPGIRYDDPRVIAKVQEAVAVVQKEVLALEGNIARLLADDKGTRFKIAFGMPTMNHEDDAVRVVLAGLAIQSRLRTLRTDTSIGIATGHVYCGEAGSPRRCEYTAVGYKVILAARLMQHAGLNGMLCDEDTYQLASHAVTFEQRPRIRLKGIEQPVPVFRPHAPHGKSLGKAGKVIGIEANKFERGGGHSAKDVRTALKSGASAGASAGSDAKGTSSPSASEAAAKMLAAIGGMKGAGGDDKEGVSTPSNGGREASVMSSMNLGISASAMANLPKGALRRLSQLQLKKSYASQSQSRLVPEARIWGREKEKDKLKHLLKRVTQEGATQICVIEAEGGVGKSAFINDFLYYVAGEQKVDVCYGAGESMEGRTPYFPWKSVFEEMLGLDSIKIVKRKNEKVLPFLPPDLLPLAALLNSFLGTNFEENDVTSNMPADGRAKNMEKLLVEIMRAKRIKSPTANPAQPKGNEDYLPRVIIMEDLHWVDSGTWNLAFDISRTVSNLLVVFTTRPLRNPTPPTYTKITRLKNATLLTLDLLSKEAMLKLACHKLGVHNIPSELFDLIQKKSGGLPLYIEEVIQTMLERKMVRIENGEVQTLNKAMDVLPDNMQGVMVGRIDHLQPQEQLTLKVCAVIGGEVKLDLLKAIHPNVSNIIDLTRICNLLCDAGFLVANNDQKGSFQFKHSYLVETAYNMLALAQRKDTHSTIMSYLETTYKHEISQYYGLLAYHASHAEQWAKALRYKELAGSAAMAVNANPEAADMFESAEEIMNKHGLRDAKRQQEIHINLGLVYFAIGRYDGAISRLSQALAALNHPIPDSDRKLGIELLKVLVREYISPSFVPSVAEKKFAEKKLRQNSSSSVSAKAAAAAKKDAAAKDAAAKDADGGGPDSPSANGRTLPPLAEGTTLNASTANGKVGSGDHSALRGAGGPRDSGVMLPGTIDEDGASNGSLGFPMGRVGVTRPPPGPKLSITGPGRKYAAAAGDGDDEKAPPAAGAGAGAHHAAHNSGDATASPPIIGSHGRQPRKVIGNHASISAVAPGLPPAHGGERNSVVSMNGAIVSRAPAASGKGGFTDLKQGNAAPNSRVMFAAGTTGGAGSGARVTGARYSVVRSTTVAPGDRKLLRTQTLYTAAKMAAERRIQLESAVKLLEKLVRACAVRGQAWRAGYCSFHLVEVAEILQNQGLVAMGCCQCAYTCFEFGWLGMGQMYASRARFIMRSESIGDGLRAQINYQDALLHVFAGEWPEAVACLRTAKLIFKRGAEHKKWRECTFAESFCLHYMAKFDDSLASLTELIESTLSDGDAYYECNGHYWKCLNMLACDGASEDVEGILTTAAALASEIKLGPSLVLAQTVLRARNQYHQTNSLLIVERLAVEHLHSLGTGATLIHLAPLFVNFATLLLDACEHKDLQQPFEPWPKRRKQFMRWAQQAVESLHTVSKMLRYAKASYLLLLGRYRWLEKRFEDARDLWSAAVGEAKRSHMPQVHALAEFELGVHPTNTPDCAARQKEHMDRCYELCKAIHLDVRNDPHMSPALGRRAEADPQYRKRRDSAQLAATTAAAAAEIAAGNIGADRKGDSSGEGSPTNAPAPAPPGGTGFTRPVPLARSHSKALAAALGNSSLDDDDAPVSTPPAPIATVPLSAVGRHSLALSGRKSLFSAQAKRMSGDKERTIELLRQASLNSSTLMGGGGNGVSGASSVASSGASTPGSAAAAPAGPMQVTVTPPIGGANGATSATNSPNPTNASGNPNPNANSNSGKPPLPKPASNVDIMPTIMASPNTSPRSGEVALAAGHSDGKSGAAPASPTTAPSSNSNSNSNSSNTNANRTSLTPGSNGTPPAQGAPAANGNSTPGTGRGGTPAAPAPALNTSGLNGPAIGHPNGGVTVATPSGKTSGASGGHSGGSGNANGISSGTGSGPNGPAGPTGSHGPNGPINAAAIPTTPKAFMLTGSLSSGNRSSSGGGGGGGGDPDSSRSGHGLGTTHGGMDRKGSGKLTVSQGNSRPASPVSANTHSALGNAPLFRVESVNSHNPLSALPPVTHGGSRKDLLPPLPHLT